MGKLSNTSTATSPKRAAASGSSKLKTKKSKTTTTYNGGQAYQAGDKTELFLLATTSFYGEDGYYESGQQRAQRLVELVHKVTKKDPEWVENFAAWLRGPGNIRTASLVVAAEYIVAGGPNGRKIIDSVCQRADEPAEILAYWTVNHYGKKTKTYPFPSPQMPKALRKGLADAANRLYNEYSELKYNTNSREVAMPQVLNLVHPVTTDPKQKALYQYIIDRAYGNEVNTELLPMIRKAHEMREVPLADRREWLTVDRLKEAGMTWESVSGWIGGPMDKDVWEKLIPTMGYMALLRNLRNFDDANVSKETNKKIAAKLTKPEQVAKSRQLPFRFYSAYQNTPSDNWKLALGEALDLCVSNIQGLEGSSLILIDLSGSMTATMSNKSSIMMMEAAALFGSALWKRSIEIGGDVDVVGFGSHHKKINFEKSSSVLNAVKTVMNTNVGHSTNLWPAVREFYNDHDRVVVFSDMQANYFGQFDSSHIDVMHMFNLAGYSSQIVDTNQPGRYIYGGLTDATFALMNNIENGLGTTWPWED